MTAGKNRSEIGSSPERLILFLFFFSQKDFFRRSSASRGVFVSPRSVSDSRDSPEKKKIRDAAM